MTKPKPADQPQRSAKEIARDPLDLNWRLYQQLGRLLDDMEAADRDETMTFPQRINAMIAIGRVQKMFNDLRKSDFNAGAGSAIDKYAAAFQTPNAVGGGKPLPRPTNIVNFDRPSEDDLDIDHDDDN